MLPLLVVLFITVPILELFVILQIGGLIGVWWTIGLLIADSLVGAVLMRSQGRTAWRRFNETLRAGRPPAREVLDGVVIIFGGALLLTPGFVTDLVGLTFLLPPSRAMLRRLLVRRFAGGLIVRATAGRARGRQYDVEGDATEVDPRRLP